MTTPSPEGAALRYNEGKPQLSKLFEFGSALDKLVRVMTQGAIKYADGNWLKGGKPVEEYLDSGMRHIRSYKNGEVYDQDSGNHHLAHAAWNMLAALRLIHDEDPDLDPEFDQASYLTQYTGHEAGPKGYPDDDPDHQDGWQVGDQFWDPDHYEGPCGWTIVTVYSNGDANAKFNDSPGLTQMRAEEFTSYAVERSS